MPQIEWEESRDIVARKEGDRVVELTPGPIRSYALVWILGHQVRLRVPNWVLSLTA